LAHILIRTVLHLRLLNNMAFYVIFTSRIFRFRLYSFAESRIMKYNSYKIQQDATMYQNFNIPYLYEAQHVSGDTAHHQEPKTALAASGFAYVEGCWTCACWTLSASSKHTSNNPPRMQNQRLLVQF